MIHIGLFEGIGGFSLAAEWMGWKTYLTCEIAEFPRSVLKHHFPNAYHHSDIKTLNYETINYELTKLFGTRWRADDIVLTGGFPCQPYSTAGLRKGSEDERHLWPEMLRVIKEVKPRWVVGENVRGLLSWNNGLVFNEVCLDLEALGYTVTTSIIPAVAVDAPHKRERIFIIAHANNSGHNSDGGEVRKEEGIQGINRKTMESGEFDRTNTPQWNVEDTLFGGCLHGESEQEGAGVWELRHIGTGDSVGVRREEVAGVTTDTNNTRTGEHMRTDGEWSEKNEGWEGQSLIELGKGGSNGTPTDTNSHGGTPSGEGKETQGDRSGDNGLKKKRSKSSKRSDGLYGLQRNATDTHSRGLEGSEEVGWNSIDAVGAGIIGDATDTDNKGLQGVENQGENRGEKGGGQTNRRRDTPRPLCPNWDEFPTQSPLCVRNDGVSTKLDGITFPKWRVESIKAGGNAVVPPLILNIFKAIEQYEQYLKA